MDPLSIGLGLIQFAPALVKWFTNSDKDAAVAQKAVDLAQKITGKGTGDEALAALRANPDLVLQYQQSVLNHDLEFEKITSAAATAQVTAVNATLQADARGDSWLQKNHHAMECMATVLFIIVEYFVLPLCKIPVPAVPESAFIMLGAILGVTSWQRGQVNKQIAANQGS